MQKFFLLVATSLPQGQVRVLDKRYNRLSEKDGKSLYSFLMKRAEAAVRHKKRGHLRNLQGDTYWKVRLASSLSVYKGGRILGVIWMKAWRLGWIVVCICFVAAASPALAFGSVAEAAPLEETESAALQESALEPTESIDQLLYLDQKEVTGPMEMDSRANDGTIADNGLLYAQLNDGTLSCIGLAPENRNPTSVTIPETVQDKPVTEIGESAFDDEDTIESLTVGENVAIIRKGAFVHCNNLRDLKLPAHMDAIEERAFYMCGMLKDFTFPEGLTEIADETFYACDRLNVVRIPEGVTEIGDYAFYSNMYLHTVELPSTVEEIRNWAFGACENLKTINIPSSVHYLGKGAFNYCWILPAPVLPEGLQEIADQAFEGCAEFDSITIPSTVKRIGVSAFESCVGLRDVSILGSVSQVSARAFAFCTELKSLYFPEGLLSIGSEAFEGTALKVDLPLSLISIGASAFQTAGTEISYAGSPSLWTRVSIGANNEGIASVDYGMLDGDPYELKIAEPSDMILGTLPNSQTPVLLGLAAGRRAPAAAPVLDAIVLDTGETIRMLTPSGESMVATSPCGTGSVVQISNDDGALLERVFVVVEGDLLGTGILSIAQLVRMASALTDVTAINGLELMAGDLNHNGNIDISDLVLEAERMRQSD